MEKGKNRWKLKIYQEDAIPLILNLVNVPDQIIKLEEILFPRMGLFGLTALQEKRYQNCIRLVLSNLLLAAQRKSNLYYARYSQVYRRELICKENRSFASFERVRYIMDQLERLELIDQFLGFEGPFKDSPRRTRVKIRQEFLNYIDLRITFFPKVKQSDHKKSFIVLKDENKHRKKIIKWDDGVRQIEDDIVKINNKYTNIKLTLELPIKDILTNPIISKKYIKLVNLYPTVPNVSIKGNSNQWINGYKYNIQLYLYNYISYIYRKAFPRFVTHCNYLRNFPLVSTLVFHIEDLLVKRVFNKNFTNGGRFYGPLYQRLSLELRQYLRIDGEETVELDYSGLHLRILYNSLGLECPENPYGNLEGELRQIFKTVCFIGLNTPDHHIGLLAIVKNIKDKFDKTISYEGAEALLSKFKELHKPIAKFFHCNQGIKLQWADSTLMNRILIRLIDEYNTVGLPIHDSIIVQKRYEEQLRQIMEEEYLKIFKFIPIIK